MIASARCRLVDPLAGTCSTGQEPSAPGFRVYRVCHTAFFKNLYSLVASPYHLCVHFSLTHELKSVKPALRSRSVYSLTQL